METESLKSVSVPMIKRTINRIVQANTQGEMKEWDLQNIVDFAGSALVHRDEIALKDIEGKTADQIETYLLDLAKTVYAEKESQLNGTEQVLEFEKVIILRVVDSKWTDHIDTMDQLRQGIGLRAYGQSNPLVEYQAEAFNLFEEMIAAIDYDVTRFLMKAQIRQNLKREQVSAGTPAHAENAKKAAEQAKQVMKQAVRVDGAKVGRNDPCPCGSGKKFKNCHGQDA